MEDSERFRLLGKYRTPFNVSEPARPFPCLCSPCADKQHGGTGAEESNEAMKGLPRGPARFSSP
jgi:hypothetical protein